MNCYNESMDYLNSIVLEDALNILKHFDTHYVTGIYKKVGVYPLYSIDCCRKICLEISIDTNRESWKPYNSMYNE